MFTLGASVATMIMAYVIHPSTYISIMVPDAINTGSIPLFCAAVVVALVPLGCLATKTVQGRSAFSVSG